MNQILSFAGIMKSIGGIVLAVAILLAMVTVHEFGHYVAGKILGFKINEFSVGFGPALFKKRSKKTGELFALRVIPLGGYCAFDGEDEMDEPQKKDEAEQPFAELNAENADGENTLPLENEVGRVEITEQKTVDGEKYPEPKGERFNDQAPWKRIIVLLAGATMNYLLALFVIVCFFAFLGRPVYQVEKKMEPTEQPMAVLDGDLQIGDVVLAVEGEKVYMITDYMDALKGKKQGDTVRFTVLRDENEIEIAHVLKADANIANISDTNTLLSAMGVEAMYAITVRSGFFETIGDTFAYSFKIGGSVLRSLGELLTGKLGIETMGGPVTTIKVTSEAASSSWMSFFTITAFIGVNLAVFNLLPVPALDGCKVVFCLIEWIRKKPVNRKVEAIIHFAGIILLFGFAILVDILQLF